MQKITNHRRCSNFEERAHWRRDATFGHGESVQNGRKNGLEPDMGHFA
jgi:hypothetical protein